MMARDYSNSIDLKIINDKELLALFQDLKTNIQSRIVVQGLKKAGNVILSQAKSNWKSTKKNKSKTNYSAYRFQMEEIKKAESLGIKIGIPKSYHSYKIRFVEHGTKDRTYKTKTGKEHFTGVLKGTEFFHNAVAARKQEAQNLISSSITQSLNNIIKKYGGY
jgi:hypothetical protein